MFKALRKWLLAGLLVIVPLAITLWVISWMVDTLDQTLNVLPAAYHPDKLLGIHIPGFGVVFSLIVLLLIGAVTSNFLGKQLLGFWNGLLSRIPVVRSIYSSVKQVSDTIFSDSGNAFRKAVLVQWPHAGMWTIGFITGSPSAELAKRLPVDCVSVYVPTTPNPTGGYFVLVPKEHCKELDMSVDEALKYIISMGVVAPAEAAAPLNTAPAMNTAAVSKV